MQMYAHVRSEQLDIHVHPESGIDEYRLSRDELFAC